MCFRWGSRGHSFEQWPTPIESALPRSEGPIVCYKCGQPRQKSNVCTQPATLRVVHAASSAEIASKNDNAAPNAKSSTSETFLCRRKLFNLFEAILKPSDFSAVIVPSSKSITSSSNFNTSVQIQAATKGTQSSENERISTPDASKPTKFKGLLEEQEGLQPDDPFLFGKPPFAPLVHVIDHILGIHADSSSKQSLFWTPV